MEAPDRIFRQAALDKLSSPEQLDQLMQVTTPKSWMALMACGALLLTGLAWSIWATIPIQVHGRGILIKSGGVFVATARGEGNVRELLVRHGQTVTNGQILARVGQPELELRKQQAEIAQQRLEAELLDLVRFHDSERATEQGDLEIQRRTYQGMISDYSAQIGALEKRVRVQMDLLANRLVSEAQMLDTRNALYAAKHEESRTAVALKQLDLGQLQTEERRRQQRLAQTNQFLLGQHTLEYLNKLLALNEEVRSPFDGEVLEIMVKEGQLVAPNAPILSLQSITHDLEARLYLSPADGKLVTNGFPVALAPVSVKKEEYGLMRGEVRDVSEFPTTPQGMLRVLENPTLVAEFSQGGAPIEVTVALEKADTRSGFRWTSAAGPPTPITSGTLCEGTITITRRQPISLLIPMLRKSVGR